MQIKSLYKPSVSFGTGAAEIFTKTCPAGLRRILLVMKLTIVLLLAAILQTAAKSNAQTITYAAESVSLEKVFVIIKQQTGYVFFYREEDLTGLPAVSVSFRNTPLATALQEILKGQPLRYSIQGKTIFITIAGNRPKKDGIPPEETIEEEQAIGITGVVKDGKGNPLAGVTVIVKATGKGTQTDASGNFSIEAKRGDILVFSSIGYEQKEVTIGGGTSLNIVMEALSTVLDDVVVEVGYGTQKKSDLTGAVASIGKERLEMVPNLNIAQAIQGALPGVMVQTSAGGAVSEQSIMIRGRNSILADNSPLIVLDGVAYTGELKDLNPNDIASIEVLRDASAAAIYGSRGANGVILITSKLGKEGKPKISYTGYYSQQDFVKFPDLMSGKEFYEMKLERGPQYITQTEKDTYESGKYSDWINLALRKGQNTEHNVSVSGGTQNTKYYFSGAYLKVQGLAVKDDYSRLTSRINLDTKITNWLSIGTRTQLSYDNLAGIPPGEEIFWINPLTQAYDEKDNLTLYPWPEDHYFANPLQNILAKNMDKSFQVLANNYATVAVPFIPGLQYRFESGIKARFHDANSYWGRNTTSGFASQGSATTGRDRSNSTIIENILSYTRRFGKHSLFLTGVYSYESQKNSTDKLVSKGFPNDFLSWYAAAQASSRNPQYSYSETVLLSQMLRLNYTYNSRYLLTLTGRRDGFSGFGAKTKWGTFPSLALGWNISREGFFRPYKETISELKLRVSYGLNGNQAIGAYQTIARLTESNYINGTSALAGYRPSTLGMDNLGWESSKTLNIGLDFGILNDRLTGDINFYRTNTFDLLLNRTISPVQGFGSITQNIGKTQNKGWELSLNSKNVSGKNFQWKTYTNISYTRNKIVSLYGELDKDGKEVDDVASAWFIGKPIRINYGYVWDGMWQLNEAEEAAKFGTKPGFVKVKDINGDGKITSDDRSIVGQTDPKVLWGLTNTLTYRQFTLSVFIHGVHGLTKVNRTIFADAADAGQTVRENFTRKDFWTPENPGAPDPINDWQGHLQQGISPMALEKAGFVRIKDITLSYDLPGRLLPRLSFDRIRVYVTGRNQFTFTRWTGIDPEFDEQIAIIPLQKELVVGLSVGF